jgi:hypothetical protein
VLPPGDCERVSGYGVMGLPFASGHVLGLRRWTVSSVGDRFTSIWHRNPAGCWTFYESVPCEVACFRYFGTDVEREQIVPIVLDLAGADSAPGSHGGRGGGLDPGDRGHGENQDAEQRHLVIPHGGGDRGRCYALWERWRDASSMWASSSSLAPLLTSNTSMPTRFASGT